MIKLGRSFGIGLGLLFILSFVLTILNYFNIVTGTFFTIMKLFIPFVSLWIAGVLFGKESKAKGWLEGLKLGLLYIFIFTILQFLLFQEPFQVDHLLYDGILVIITIFGSMIGINMKASQK